MASSKKFVHGAVRNQLRHIERQLEKPSNKDIDMEKIDLDYSLSPQRDISSYQYYQERKSQLYVYARSDVITMVGWIVTAPKDLLLNQEDLFFQETYHFLENRYGTENVISAVVHKDESGSPHLHFCFIPAVTDTKRGGEKLCASNIMDKKELRNFHPALQKHLDSQGVHAKVMTGVTRAQGGNRSVREMKRERDIERTRTIERDRRRWE